MKVAVITGSSKGIGKAIVNRLKKDGYKAYWKKADSAGQVWYVVYVGPFENLNTAKIHLNALKQSGHKPILFSVSKSE